MADNERLDLPADVDVLLRRALAVEPSPEFLPRVREKVREEPRPSWWMAPWILVPVAATVTVALGLAVFPGPPVSPQPPAAPVVRTAASERGVPPLAAIQPTASPRPRPVSRRPLRAPQDSPVAPVVIVDQRQRAALGLFLRMAQQGRLPEETLAQTMPTPNQPIEEQILPIAVEPVAVSPIPAGGVLHNEIERN